MQRDYLNHGVEFKWFYTDFFFSVSISIKNINPYLFSSSLFDMTFEMGWYTHHQQCDSFLYGKRTFLNYDDFLV